MIAFTLAVAGQLFAQDEPGQPAKDPATTETTGAPETPISETSPKSGESIKESAKKMVGQVETEAEKIAEKMDRDPRAIKVKAGILEPIYTVAKALSFPAFHWLAFALMASGVVSYTLQLVIGKLIVLTRMGFSLKEIISDLTGLAISVVGLVLTTHAAAENSTFTQSAAAVISATAVGVVFGFILYLWGQRQEIEAAAGRTPTSRPVRGK